MRCPRAWCYALFGTDVARVATQGETRRVARTQVARAICLAHLPTAICLTLSAVRYLPTAICLALSAYASDDTECVWSGTSDARRRGSVA
eukprot:2634021-Rhodomonas_salina.1